jgi:glycerol-3-phosphate dehydrogenase (NAD(P)+)
MKISVLGAGAWGTALASRLAHNVDHRVMLWGRDPRVVDAINNTRLNPQYLPDIALAPALGATNSLRDAVADSELIILGAPVAATELLLRDVPDHSRAPLVSLSKGFVADNATVRLLPNVLGAYGDAHGVATGLISGPSFAGETARGL